MKQTGDIRYMISLLKQSVPQEEFAFYQKHNLVTTIVLNSIHYWYRIYGNINKIANREYKKFPATHRRDNEECILVSAFGWSNALLPPPNGMQWSDIYYIVKNEILNNN